MGASDAARAARPGRCHRVGRQGWCGHSGSDSTEVGDATASRGCWGPGTRSPSEPRARAAPSQAALLYEGDADAEKGKIRSARGSRLRVTDPDSYTRRARSGPCLVGKRSGPTSTRLPLAPLSWLLLLPHRGD